LRRISSARAVLSRPPCSSSLFQIDQIARIDRVREEVVEPALQAEEVAGRQTVLVGARALGFVAQGRFVGDGHFDREHVADGARALVLEERARPLPPQRIGRIDLQFLGGHGQRHRPVARLRHRVLDRRELWRLTHLAQALDGVGTAAEQRQGGPRQHRQKP
jgi:hypothetical protein